MTYFVYLARCGDGSLYCGVSQNVAKRIRQHNSGAAGAKYTRSRRPVVLVYQKPFATLRLALREEYRVKKLPRSEKLKLLKTAHATSNP